MSEIISLLSGVGKVESQFLLNSLARSRYSKQEIAVKLWIILGMPIDKMSDQILYAGVDSGIISKEDSINEHFLDIKGGKFFGTSDVELNKTSKVNNQRLVDDNWALFKLLRRSTEDLKVIPKTDYLYKDDLEQLKQDIETNHYSMANLSDFLVEAARYGAVQCFRHLISCGAVVNNRTLIEA